MARSICGHTPTSRKGSKAAGSAILPVSSPPSRKYRPPTGSGVSDGNAGEFECRRVDHGRVPAAMGDVHRVTGHRGVDVAAGERPAFREAGVVVHRAQHPLARRRLLRLRGERGLHVADARQADVRRDRIGRPERVAVRVDEARRHGMAARVQHFRVRALEIEHVLDAADGEDVPASHRNGAGLRDGGIHAEHDRARDDEVRRAGGFLCGGLCRAGDCAGRGDGGGGTQELSSGESAHHRAPVESKAKYGDSAPISRK